MKKNTVLCRFYEELNDFLPLPKRKTWFEHSFDNSPTIKDLIESLGVPHTAVDLIVVNGESVKFSYCPKNGDRICVYPVFESFDISQISQLRPKPLRELKFIVDADLGPLAEYLQMAGFDTLYQSDYSQEDIIKADRIVLTKNASLLKNKNITRAYLLRALDPKKQLAEVIARFDLTPKLG